MNWDAIGAVGEGVGAVAVVFSLIYLAMQIRLQNRESRQAAMHAVAEGWRDAIGRAGEPEVVDLTMRGLEDFHALEPAEQWLLMSRMLNIFRVGEEAYMLHCDGRLDHRYWLGIFRYLANFVSIAGVQQMWALRKSYYYEDYQAFIDDLIRASERTSPNYADTLRPDRSQGV